MHAIVIYSTAPLTHACLWPRAVFQPVAPEVCTRPAKITMHTTPIPALQTRFPPHTHAPTLLKVNDRAVTPQTPIGPHTCIYFAEASPGGLTHHVGMYKSSGTWYVPRRIVYIKMIRRIISTVIDQSRMAWP